MIRAAGVISFKLEILRALFAKFETPLLVLLIDNRGSGSGFSSPNNFSRFSSLPKLKLGFKDCG